MRIVLLCLLLAGAGACRPEENRRDSATADDSTRADTIMARDTAF